MSDPKPGTPPDPTDQPASDETTDDRSGGAPVDNSGGIEANEVNPDLPLIDPTGGEGA